LVPDEGIDRGDQDLAEGEGYALPQLIGLIDCVSQEAGGKAALAAGDVGVSGGLRLTILLRQPA